MAESTGMQSASQIQMDYMRLLVTQLQNQNPLEPMDNNQMASQLAQFAQLSQMEQVNSGIDSMNTSFGAALHSANSSYATSLIGKNVTFFTEDPMSGMAMTTVGRVTSVGKHPDTGENLLGVTVSAEEGAEPQEYTLGLGAVQLIENPVIENPE